MAYKTNTNVENDRMTSAGNKAVNASVKASRARATAMKDPATRKATMDFIFGGSNETVSPLAG